MLDESQQKAVDGISKLDRSLYVMTGGGGCGKTYTTKHIIKRLWDDPHSGITRERTFAGCPTGKAAKVLTDALNDGEKDNFLQHSPATIHRMLAYHPRMGWTFNRDNPLSADLVILDESSMVDSLLMSRVIDAMPKKCKLILIGDVEQVCPVGAGQPFADLIRCGDQSIIYRLLVNHRQQQGSLIATNCMNVLTGDKLIYGEPGAHTLGGVLEDDFFLHEEDDKEEIPEKVINISREWNDNRLDYAIIAPQHTGVCGIKNMNETIQESFNPPGPDKSEISVKGTTIRTGDRVIQTRNNYDLEVFNGYMGNVIAVDPYNGVVIVDFDGNNVTYSTKEDIADLQLGYCMTIHKAQGSQFQYGIVIAHSSHYFMWSRNLLYTGLSRYRKELHIIGDKKAINRGRQNVKTTLRRTFIQLHFRHGVV